MDARFNFHHAKLSDLSQLESLIAAPYPASSRTRSARFNLARHAALSLPKQARNRPFSTPRASRR
jgi:hypothetical protein